MADRWRRGQSVFLRRPAPGDCRRVPAIVARSGHRRGRRRQLPSGDRRVGRDLAGCGISRRTAFTGRTRCAERFFVRFVLATVAIAAIGLVVGLALRSPGLMKFYPFRLFDIFLPMAFSVIAAGLLERAVEKFARQPATGGKMLATTIGHLAA